MIQMSQNFEQNWKYGKLIHTEFKAFKCARRVLVGGDFDIFTVVSLGQMPSVVCPVIQLPEYIIGQRAVMSSIGTLMQQ